MISPVKIWRRQKYIRTLLGKEGKVLTWTFTYVASNAFKKYAPYPVVMVEFTDGEKAFGSLVDCNKDDIKIGMKVKAVLRKVRQSTEEDIIAYGVKFQPL